MTRTWQSASPFLWVTAPFLLTLQASLLQRPQTQSLTVSRAIILIPILYATYTSCDTYFVPEREFIIFNVVIHITKAWACLRAIELGLARERYTWKGYDQAYYGSASTKRSDIAKTRTYTYPPTPSGFIQTITYGWSCLSSLCVKQ